MSEKAEASIDEVEEEKTVEDKKVEENESSAEANQAPAPVIDLQAYRAKKSASLKRVELKIEIKGKTFSGRMFLSELLSKDCSPISMKFFSSDLISVGDVIQLHAGEEEELQVEARVISCSEMEKTSKINFSKELQFSN